MQGRDGDQAGGCILTEHFGRRLTGRAIRIDLTGVSQRWLRDLIWDHLVAILRSPRCPRSGGTFDDMRRAGLELSTFLELHAPARGHDPRALTAEHMHQFVADQRQRERDGLVSLAARGVHGKPSIVTANTRQRVFHRTRRLLRGALESGEAERLGLDRAFIAAMPTPGRMVSRVQVTRLPGRRHRHPKTLWLWCRPSPVPAYGCAPVMWFQCRTCERTLRRYVGTIRATEGVESHLTASA